MCSFTLFVIKIYDLYTYFIIGKLSLEKTQLNLGISVLLKGWSETKNVEPQDPYYHSLFLLSWLLFQEFSL